MATTTTIQVSTINRDALLRLGRIMQERHPEIWSNTPSFNAVVGYALTHIDGDIDPEQLLPADG